MPRSGTIEYGNRAVMFCFVRYAHYLFGRRGVRVFIRKYYPLVWLDDRHSRLEARWKP